MRVLITGGTGFIGSSLAHRLLDTAHHVRILSQINTKAEEANARELRQAGVEIIEGSVADRELYPAALESVDIVHHIAATMREADVPDSHFWDTNVSATKDLIRTCREQKVRRFVYCSTMGVTGQLRGTLVDESAPYSPKDIYTKTKAAAEELVLGKAASMGFPATVVRPVDVYGPRDRRLLKMFRMIQTGRFIYLGRGHGRRHMIYIDDLINGMIAAQREEAAVGEVFLLAGPAPIRLEELVGMIADELGVPAPKLHLPYRPAWLISALVQGLCRPLKVQPPIYPRRVEFYAHDYAFDISKARETLGFEPTVDMREGVRRTIEDYRERRFLA